MLLCIISIIAVSTVGIMTSVAQDVGTVYADNISTNAGESVRIPVLIKNNAGLAGAKLLFTYDADVLTPISVDAGDVFDSGLQDNIEGDAVAGSFKVYWASSTGDNNTSNGILFYLNFDVSSSAYGTSSIGISYDQADTFDEEFNDVALECENISLDIANDSLNGKTKIVPNITISQPNSCKLINLSFNITNINGLSELNISIGFDSTEFAYNQSLINSNVVSNQSNILTINTKIDSSMEGTDYASVQFRTLPDAQSGDFTFYITTNNDDVVCSNAEITIATTDTTDAAKIYIPSMLSVEKGKTISVPVMISNNKGLMGYRLTFTYDSTQLEIESVTNGENFAGNISDSIGNTNGTFDVVWNSTEDNTSNDTLLYLNFKNIANLGESGKDSTIGISYTASDTFNENYEDVEFSCTDGTLRLCPGHKYSENVTKPTCKRQGYTWYRCHYCYSQYNTDFVEPLGHYYVYQKDTSSVVVNKYTMTYKCKDCTTKYSTNGDDVMNLFTNEFINTEPIRSDLNSQLLDTNNDGIINAKDYAMIMHASQSK